MVLSLRETDNRQQIVVPSVHLNGTSREELKTQVEGAYRAVVTARMMLQEMAPHGRDYYPQGDEALSRARAEWQSRIDRVESVMRELATIYTSLEE